MPDDTKAARLKEPRPQVENLGAALIEGNHNAVAHCMETLLALTQEITSFTQHRFREDMDSLFTLAANGASSRKRPRNTPTRSPSSDG